MPYTYQPSTANYCFYHEDDYVVCVGDGSKPSQFSGDRRKHKPAGVPILKKIKDKPNPVEEAFKKKAAAYRKKEYDRLYAHANRRYKPEESKGAYTRPRETKLFYKEEAKKKLEALRATNDRLVKVRERKDDKEKQLAITKFESKWNNTDRAKSFKNRMDAIKAQADSKAKTKALQKVKKEEEAEKKKHMEIKSNAIKVLEADIDLLEKKENKAIGLSLIKKMNEEQRDKAALVIQKLERKRQAVVEKKKREEDKKKKTKLLEKLKEEEENLAGQTIILQKQKKEAEEALSDLSSDVGDFTGFVLTDSDEEEDREYEEEVKRLKERDEKIDKLEKEKEPLLKQYKKATEYRDTAEFRRYQKLEEERAKAFNFKLQRDGAEKTIENEKERLDRNERRLKDAKKKNKKDKIKKYESKIRDAKREIKEQKKILEKTPPAFTEKQEDEYIELGTKYTKKFNDASAINEKIRKLDREIDRLL